MNDQIQQLAEQAKKSVPHGLAVDKWIETYNQLFAGLIVNKCAELASEETSLPYNSYGEKIRKHFGIE
jgi:hypothetical protein